MVKRNIYDIVNVLSTDERHYLIRNNGDMVKVDSLVGKYVVLFYMHFPTHHDDFHPLCLVEAYTNLYPKGHFEIVFVACTEDVDEDSHEWFNKYFSKMPWLAIPFYDLESRNHVFNVLSLPSLSRGDCMIINPFGQVLDDCSLFSFELHGADWYPFTAQREEDIDREQIAAVKARSLNYFLSSPYRDYVFTNHGDKVPIADLESKPVGLYFYDGTENITEKFVGIYKKLKARDVNFEIVLINLYTDGGYTDEESFTKGINEMPWLTLPFGETKCAKLASIFGFYRELDTALVVVKSGEFYEPYAMRIIEDYGIEAYPFTRERAAQLEIERRSIFFLFDKEDQKYVIRNLRDEKNKVINVSVLQGRTMIMLFASSLDVESLSKLIRWYTDMKRMDDGFEIIYVSGCKTSTEFDEIFTQMPWLALPFGTGSKIRQMFRSGMGISLVAFGLDGRLLAKTVINNPEDWNLLSKDSYPFGIHNNILDHVLGDIQYDNMWGTLD